MPEVRRSVRSLAVRVWWLDTSRAARRVLDMMHFGTGTSERLLASLVIGALFVLAFVGVVTASGQPTRYGVAVGLTSLVVGLALTAFLVVPRADERLDDDRAAAREAVIVARRERALADRDEADRADQKARQPRKCPYCRESIPRSAVKCRHCGEIVDDELRQEREDDRAAELDALRPRSNPGVAAVLSFFWPGLGQIYRGRLADGLLWMIAVPVGYVCCIVPGIVLHWLCIFAAASGRDRR